MRGRPSQLFDAARLPDGSSPQVRGRLARAGARAQRSGLIPAGAGQTPWLFFVAVAARAHPRRCGADRTEGQLLPRSRGSSPQVRGRPYRAGQSTTVPGLIPAGAGQTVAVNGADRVAGAHPRRCGADAHSALNDQEPPGSSPQVRGRRGDWVISERRTGLIPAGAGQTRNGAQSTSRFWAHPRRCGADQCAQKQILDGMGSSPQVRGRRQPGSEASPFSGLIPAGAGQTRTRHGERRRGRAHPRRCGADRTAPGRTPVPHGSSPQVRGRLHVERHVGARRGLIPAGAGQTPDNFTSGYGQRAHPRRCGADDWALPHDTVFPGSSPQVRGRPAAVHPSQPAPGLIPAGAGQTTQTVRPPHLARAHPRRCGADPWRPATLHRPKDLGGQLG